MLNLIMVNQDSKLHLLKPINLEFSFKYCLIHNDPDYPITKLSGTGCPIHCAVIHFCNSKLSLKPYSVYHATYINQPN